MLLAGIPASGDRGHVTPMLKRHKRDKNQEWLK